MERTPKSVNSENSVNANSKALKKAALPAVLVFNLLLSACAINKPNEQTMQYPFTQCGGDVEGHKTPSDHTIFVLRQNTNGSFEAFDLGWIGGQCGNTYPAPDNMVSPFPNGQREGMPVSLGTSDGDTYFYTRTFTQLGGSMGAMYFDSTHTLFVDEFTNKNGEKKYSARDLGKLD